MKLRTRQFGEIELAEDSLITFPSGLLGFEALHDFVLLDEPQTAPLQWLQSVDDPQLAFTVLDPQLVFADYAPTLSDEDRELLGLAAGEAALVRVMVTVPADPSEMTANLLGPLLINPASGKGRQIVLHDSDYPVRQRLLPEAAAV